MAMTTQEREKEIKRLKKIGAKGRQSFREKLGEEEYKKHMSRAGKKGARAKWKK